VINDVADHDNGSDAANLQREYPFTGGSRFIQTGVLTRRQMAWLAGALFALVTAGGLWLVWQAGAGLFYTGLAGVVLGWGYSAPPLRLNSRGLGELTVALCFALLPIGLLQVLQAPAMAAWSWLAAGYGVAAALLLFANQFPDRDADALAGKRHWVVRLGHPAAVRGYLLLAVLAMVLPACCRCTCAPGVPCSNGNCAPPSFPLSWRPTFTLCCWPPACGCGQPCERHPMIGRLSGTLIEKLPPQITVDVNGVGYDVDVTMTTFYQLPALGQKTTLFTHLVVREDAHLLYGFASRDERETFRQLIKVSGIGAKIALAILSGMSTDELAVAVASEDLKRLSSVPGIGKKTAERLVLELRGKLASGSNLTVPGGLPFAATPDDKSDIVNALLALGYNDKEAAAATKGLPLDVTVSDGVRLALKNLMKG